MAVRGPVVSFYPLTGLRVVHRGEQFSSLEKLIYLLEKCRCKLFSTVKELCLWQSIRTKPVYQKCVSNIYRRMALNFRTSTSFVKWSATTTMYWKQHRLLGSGPRLPIATRSSASNEGNNFIWRDHLHKQTQLLHIQCNFGKRRGYQRPSVNNCMSVIEFHAFVWHQDILPDCGGGSWYIPFCGDYVIWQFVSVQVSMGVGGARLPYCLQWNLSLA